MITAYTLKKESLTPETLWVSLKSLVNILFPDIHIPGTF
jgi:hypothetical protein